MKPILGTFFLVVLAATAGAQSGKPVWKHSPSFEGPALPFNLDDFVEINLPPATRFTKAVEVEIQIPREIFDQHANLAVALYQKTSNSTERPSAQDRVAWEVLPTASRFYIQIPLIANAGLKASIDTAVVKGPIAFPLILSIQTLDKQTTPELIQAIFQIRIRWLNANLGGLSLLTPGLSPDQRKQLKIVVGGQLQPSEGVLFLEPGVYDVTLSLPGYKTAALTTAVAQAKVTEISTLLEEDTPYVAFEAPSGTQIVLDGKRVPASAWNSLAIAKGVHTIQFTIGGYQVTDNFEITRGGLHKVSLVLQVAFEEE